MARGPGRSGEGGCRGPSPREGPICHCQAFSDALGEFKASLRCHVSGLCDDYMLKCMFDCLVNVGLVRAGIISAWPTRCPGYAAALRHVYPEVPPRLHFLALCHFYFLMKKKREFASWNPCDAWAQLCWDHRRDQGYLRDVSMHRVP